MQKASFHLFLNNVPVVYVTHHVFILHTTTKNDVRLRVDFRSPTYSCTLAAICFSYDIPGDYLFICFVYVRVSICAGFEEEFSTFS